jgi:RNA polymerase sigma-70 factor (ECF subfamily)
MPLTTTATRLTDAELMRRVQADDPEAFRHLYQRHVQSALAVAYGASLGSRQAEEAVQDAFLSLWRARAAYRPARGSVAGWLLTIVRNRALDLARRRATHDRPWAQLSDFDLPDPQLEELDDQAARREQGRAVRAAFTSLPTDQATVLGLAYFDGLTQAEIAMALDVPLGTVKSRIRLGLQRLAGELRPFAQHAPSSLAA